MGAARFPRSEVLTINVQSRKDFPMQWIVKESGREPDRAGGLGGPGGHPPAHRMGLGLEVGHPRVEGLGHGLPEGNALRPPPATPEGKVRGSGGGECPRPRP